jgi:hypothetical protein
MTHLRPLCRALPAATILILSLAPTGRAATPQELAALWCTAAWQHDDVAATELMAPSLQELVARATEASAAFALRFPDEKPPLGDGLPLSAFPDPTQECRAESLSAEEIVLLYTPLPSGEGQWRDKLLLESIPGTGDPNQVLVADILFDLPRGHRLSGWLIEAAAIK